MREILQVNSRLYFWRKFVTLFVRLLSIRSVTFNRLIPEGIHEFSVKQCYSYENVILNLAI